MTKRGIRQAFLGPADAKLVHADYAELELRALALGDEGASMTTKDSPLYQLKLQAGRIAKQLIAMANGANPSNDPLGKIAAARARGVFDVGIMMDDKLLKILIPLDVIKASTEATLAEWIVQHMQEKKAN